MAPGADEDRRPRHFRFVLDLRKLCLQEACRGRAVLRFSYPHFGDACELRSGPVPLPCRRPATVPRATFEFNFAASCGWLRSTLRRFAVEVRVEEADTAELLGRASVPLHPVLQQQRVHTTSSLGVRGFQQSHLAVTAVRGPDGAAAGQLTVAMSLDGLGEAAGLEAEMYAAARELEQWKQEQKVLFQNQREAAHLATLTEEWKRRDAERELQVQKRLREAVALEDKLRAGLSSAACRLSWEAWDRLTMILAEA
ncbi:centrosomal protein of 120 kDa-like [Pollicipes pollicipes]|uniref:centrosomal protein of 120 kDa-like n=1 Tax=Pollicipes pollicipes TaxID=41117 RepID=UPI001884D1D2|nr:centrosomal protein of 120 kDa-like [Pollicipes pollicipes]